MSMARPMIPLGGTMKVVDMTTGQVTEKPSGMMMLPAAPGKCPECAVDHPPELPHNRDSLFYQMRFHAAHQRWPVWSDALAHCDEAMRTAWESELRSRGVWREPEPVQPVKHETPVPADALLQPGTEINTQDAAGGADRPGRILAVVPRGVPVEFAVADQNGQPRPSTWTINRARQTQYVVEVTNADGTTARAVIGQRAFQRGLTNAKPRE